MRGREWKETSLLNLSPRRMRELGRGAGEGQHWDFSHSLSSASSYLSPRPTSHHPPLTPVGTGSGWVHMTTSRFMWELISSLPVSGWVLKSSSEPKCNSLRATCPLAHSPPSAFNGEGEIPAKVDLPVFSLWCEMKWCCALCAKIRKLALCGESLILSEQRDLCLLQEKKNELEKAGG